MNTCIQFLEETANKNPEKTAIVDHERSYTFREIRLNALKIAQVLDQFGAGRPVAIFLPKSCQSILSFMGVLYSGNFYVPLDIKSPQDRLAQVIRDLGPVALITNTAQEKSISEMLPDGNIKVINIDSILNSKEEISFDHTTRTERVIDTDPIYCIYTSGSTGTPKGVVVSHRGVMDYLDYIIESFELNQDTILGNQTQFHFDVSVVDIFVPMKMGATLHIIPEQLFTFPAKLAEFMDAKQINTIYWVPSAMNQVSNSNALSLQKCDRLKKVLFAGEVMPIKTLNYWRKHLPEALFANLYGPTEITVTCTHYIVDRDFADHESLPIGKPCRNTDVLVLDEQNRLIEANDTTSLGELCVRGSSLALGYWGDFEKTATVFIQNPLNQHYPEKIYRTGDFVKYNARGELEYHGRKDRQIKHMGYRIELGEIDQAILRFKEIDNACVLYDAKEKSLVCFFESKHKEIDETFLRNKLIGALPKYMIPTSYVKLPLLPIGSTGKVDVALIRKNYDDGKNR